MIEFCLLKVRQDKPSMFQPAEQQDALLPREGVSRKPGADINKRHIYLQGDNVGFTKETLTSI